LQYTLWLSLLAWWLAATTAIRHSVTTTAAAHCRSTEKSQ
jgi:hypothetical protein